MPVVPELLRVMTLAQDGWLVADTFCSLFDLFLQCVLW